MELVVGGIVVAVASFLGGVTGFGYSLVATPLLLLDGYSLRFVVTVNLALALVTQLSVAVRFRRSAWPRRVALLIGGAIPGLWLGVEVLGRVDPSDIKVAARRRDDDRRRPDRALGERAAPAAHGARRGGGRRVPGRLPRRIDVAERRRARAPARARQGLAAQFPRRPRDVL